MSAWLKDDDGEMLSDYEDEEEDGDDEDGDVMDSSDGDDDGDDDGEDDARASAVGMSDDEDDDEDDAGAADDAVAAAEWRRLRQAAMHDRDFPDEVDVPFDVSARQRFARFRSVAAFLSLLLLTQHLVRGLKSLRTSPWDPKEQVQPPNHADSTILIPRNSCHLIIQGFSSSQMRSRVRLWPRGGPMPSASSTYDSHFSEQMLTLFTDTASMFLSLLIPCHPPSSICSSRSLHQERLCCMGC
jgi:hypothetical protein